MEKSTHRNEAMSTTKASFDQLQKFWNGLTRHGRQELLKVDKQTFLKQVRKVIFCPRCFRFLDEEFSGIVKYGKSSKQDGAVAHLSYNAPGIPESQCDDQDPSVHPWGCLTTTRDESLTLLDCYFQSSSFKGIQKVFDNAHTIESTHKSLYPAACGVGGRRWKGAASRETCAVHTVGISLEKLVKFWSSQGEESRQSILKMKEEDFVEKLNFRIEDKKFCKNCRKNILGEFKELKELMSRSKESGFHFHHKISHATVKAHTSMEKQYVHSRLVAGDGFVTITEGESIQDLFKHGEEIMKVDNSLLDKNGNRLDRACSHSRKDARTPDFARKVLLDAATVFFKEQVDKAVREEVARQNSHSVFVSLAVNLLEECVQVSSREMLTLENQIKLLDEEENEKNEEEERKERRRVKEREKKLRKKERSKEKGKTGDNISFTKQHSASHVNTEESTVVDEEPDTTDTIELESSRPIFPHIQDELKMNETRNKFQDEQEISPGENCTSSNSKNGSTGSDQPNQKQFRVVPRSRTTINKSEKRYHGYHFDTSSRSANKFTLGDHINYSRGRPKHTSVAWKDSRQRKKGEANTSVPSSKSLPIEPFSTMKSEPASQLSDSIDASRRLQTGVRECEEVVTDKKQLSNGGEVIRSCLLDGRRIHTPVKVSKENGNVIPDVSRMYLQAQGIPEKQLNAAAGEENLKSDLPSAEDKGFSFFYFDSPLALAEDKGFSFFHFDSPFAFADASKSDSLPLEDSVGGNSLAKFYHQSKGDLTSNMIYSFEEYNLFATNKGITFSIISILD